MGPGWIFCLPISLINSFRDELGCLEFMVAWVCPIVPKADLIYGDYGCANIIFGASWALRPAIVL